MGWLWHAVHGPITVALEITQSSEVTTICIINTKSGQSDLAAPIMVRINKRYTPTFHDIRLHRLSVRAYSHRMPTLFIPNNNSHVGYKVFVQNIPFEISIIIFIGAVTLQQTSLAWSETESYNHFVTDLTTRHKSRHWVFVYSEARKSQKLRSIIC
jgi:hypothetical protein